ncbi:MAG: hypothetical protein RR365_02260 [Bacteroides sp.]
MSEMLYALTSAYSKKDYNNRLQVQFLETNIGKLFSVFAWGLSLVNKQSELIMLWDDLDNARDFVLDRYGANFGVKRLNSDDRFYRLSIKVKLMSQLSGGDSDTIINAAASLFDIMPEKIEIEEIFPAKIVLYLDISDFTLERQEMLPVIIKLIKRIIAAGIGMRFIATAQQAIIINADFRPSAFVVTHSKTGTEPRRAVILTFDGIRLDETLSPVTFTVKHEQTSKHLHTGTEPSNTLIFDLVTADVHQILDNEVFEVEFTRSGTEPQPSVLGSTDAAGIATEINPVSYSVKFRKCGTGITKL